MDDHRRMVAQRLRELRGTRKQREIAQEAGVTTMAISQYENGKRLPRAPIMAQLARVFGVSVDDLFFKF